MGMSVIGGGGIQGTRDDREQTHMDKAALQNNRLNDEYIQVIVCWWIGTMSACVCETAERLLGS